MGKIGGFQIKFYGTRKTIREDDALTIAEWHEAGDKSADYIETLVYFATARSLEDFQELDAISFAVYQKNMRELIESFLSITRAGLAELERHRVELERIVENSSTIG